MSWHEPGKDKCKDPWSGREKEDMAPELDEVLKRIQAKIYSVFGGSGGKSYLPSSKAIRNIILRGF